MRRLVNRTAVIAGLIAVLAAAGCTQKNNGPAGSAGGAAEGGKHQVAFVPKLQGIPYFEAMNTGGKSAEQALGDVTWLYQGPTQADAAAQTQIVRSFIQRGVQVIVVAPNDPDSMAPVLKEAQAKGIKVMTSDTDAPNSVRDVFVSQASTQKIGEALTDNLLKAMGGKGKYAIVSCGETADNLNSWIKVQQAYTAQKYPQAQIVDVVYAGEDQAKSTQMAADLMNAHPDLTGLVGECTSSAPGVAQAVKDANKIGKVFTVGLGTPQAMKPYLTDGSSSGAILWDVEQLGYLTAWAGDQLATGKALQPVNHVSDKLPSVSWDAATKTLLLGDPLVITKDNADQFNY
jgi:rhamnose transport system substrate-binding protein